MTDPQKPHQRLDYQAARPRPPLPDREELCDRTIARFERLYEEAADQGAKVMGLAVHPYISGVAHRIGWFERTLTYLASRAGTMFWQGRQIMHWYSHAATPVSAA